MPRTVTTVTTVTRECYRLLQIVTNDYYSGQLGVNRWLVEAKYWKNTGEFFGATGVIEPKKMVEILARQKDRPRGPKRS